MPVKNRKTDYVLMDSFTIILHNAINVYLEAGYVQPYSIPYHCGYLPCFLN